MPISPAQLLSPAEVAGRLRIGRSTVYELIDRGEIPAVRVGRQYRVEPERLDAYLREQSVHQEAA